MYFAKLLASTPRRRNNYLKNETSFGYTYARKGSPMNATPNSSEEEMVPSRFSSASTTTPTSSTYQHPSTW
jgi:hypothetical protein